MPSRKSMEQVMTWLNSKAADKNSLDGINAELCISVINELRMRLERLGVQFYNIKQSTKATLQRQPTTRRIDQNENSSTCQEILF